MRERGAGLCGCGLGDTRTGMPCALLQWQSMNTHVTVSKLDKTLNEPVAIFGTAELRRTVRGAYRLVGGSEDDRRSAREWVSMFLHEAVVS